MHLPLKFVTEIVRSWEKLNSELINQNSVDSYISNLLSEATCLAIKLSHFPELENKKSIRTEKNNIPFSVIIDVADIAKHKTLNDGEDRNNEISISSYFEVNLDNKCRFIRNVINIKHTSYGSFDFLQVAKEAISYLFSRLNYMIFWNPLILEAPEIFTDSAFLKLNYKNQIAFTNSKIEFFRRNEEGILIHFDPQELPFELEEFDGIESGSYHKYVKGLLNRSISSSTILEECVIVNTSDLNYKNGQLKVDFLIRKRFENGIKRIVVMLVDDSIGISQINYWNEQVTTIEAESIVLVARNQITEEPREYLLHSTSNLNLIELKSNKAINVPLNFFDIGIRHSNLKIDSVEYIRIGVLEEHKQRFPEIETMFGMQNNCNFTKDKKRMMSLNELCLSYVKNSTETLSGTKILDIKPRDRNRNIFFKINDELIKIGLEVKFNWIDNVKNEKAPVLTFEKNAQGVSLWKLSSAIKLGNKTQSVQFTVLKYGDTDVVGII